MWCHIRSLLYRLQQDHQEVKVQILAGLHIVIAKSEHREREREREVRDKGGGGGGGGGGEEGLWDQGELISRLIRNTLIAETYLYNS